MLERMRDERNQFIETMRRFLRSDTVLAEQFDELLERQGLAPARSAVGTIKSFKSRRTKQRCDPAVPVLRPVIVF